ncbi:MAG: hypothetical protein ACR2H1_09055, partial [Limisphaerales bacterium]
VSTDPSGTLGKGFNGFTENATKNGINTFEIGRGVTVWSFGPDGTVAFNAKANAGLNKDNVLGWSK